jgi:hypothetical protein
MNNVRIAVVLGVAFACAGVAAPTRGADIIWKKIDTQEFPTFLSAYASAYNFLDIIHMYQSNPEEDGPVVDEPEPQDLFASAGGVLGTENGDSAIANEPGTTIAFDGPDTSVTGFSITHISAWQMDLDPPQYDYAHGIAKNFVRSRAEGYWWLGNFGSTPPNPGDPHTCTIVLDLGWTQAANTSFTHYRWFGFDVFRTNIQFDEDAWEEDEVEVVNVTDDGLFRLRVDVSGTTLRVHMRDDDTGDVDIATYPLTAASETIHEEVEFDVNLPDTGNGTVISGQGVRIAPRSDSTAINDPITSDQGGSATFASYLAGDKWYFGGTPPQYAVAIETLLELAIYAHTIE